MAAKAQGLPCQVLALDLSLTATGLFRGDPYAPSAHCVRQEIATPDRRTGESDMAWNARRFHVFARVILDSLREHPPQVLVIEVTSHAHQVITRGRGTPDERRERATRGTEFRAGLGLGRALGWLDGVLAIETSSGTPLPEVVTIEAGDVKLRVAGSKTANKAAVAAALRGMWGWDTSGWRESEIDALACGLAWLRTAEMDAQERTSRALAEKQARRPSRPSRAQAVPRTPEEILTSPPDQPERARVQTTP